MYIDIVAHLSLIISIYILQYKLAVQWDPYGTSKLGAMHSMYPNCVGTSKAGVSHVVSLDFTDQDFRFQLLR